MWWKNNCFKKSLNVNVDFAGEGSFYLCRVLIKKIDESFNFSQEIVFCFFCFSHFFVFLVSKNDLKCFCKYSCECQYKLIMWRNFLSILAKILITIIRFFFKFNTLKKALRVNFSVHNPVGATISHFSLQKHRHSFVLMLLLLLWWK